MKLWHLVSGVALACAAACNSDGPCGEIYDKNKACWEKEAESDKERAEIPARDLFVAACKMAPKKEVEQMATCSKEPNCEAIQACMRSAGEAEFTKEQVEEVNGFIKDGDWLAAFKECQFAAERMKANAELSAACEKVFAEGLPTLTTPDAVEEIKSTCRYSEDLKAVSATFKKACDGLAVTELEAKKQAAIAARDAGTEDYALCFDLQSAAEAVSEAEKKAAGGMCAEMTAAVSAKKAIDEAKANSAAKKGELPYYCSSSAEELAKIEPKSDWSKKTLDAVLQACFVDHGKVAIAAALPGMSYCPYEITQLREAVATYGLAGRDPELDALLGKTDKVCKK